MNDLPEFGPQLTWHGARYAVIVDFKSHETCRDKFKELIKIHEAQDKAGRAESGGGDEVANESVALLDDLLSLIKDDRDEKIRVKHAAQLKDSKLNEQGAVIRKEAMKTLGKRGSVTAGTFLFLSFDHVIDLHPEGEEKTSPAKRHEYSSMTGITSFLEKKAELELQRMELEQRKLDFEMQKWESTKAQQNVQTELLLELLKQQQKK